MSATAPNYLSLSASSSSYYFRVSIPKDLREVFNKKEFRISLSTALLRDAKPIAKSLSVYVQEVFDRMRLGEIRQEGLSIEDIKESLRVIKNNYSAKVVDGNQIKGVTNNDLVSLNYLDFGLSKAQALVVGAFQGNAKKKQFIGIAHK